MLYFLQPSEDSWNVISELEQQISQPILADSVQRVSPRHKPATFLRGGNPVKIANDSTRALIDDTAKREQVINRPDNMAFQPYERWTKMEEYLQKIEEYRKVCRHNGKGGLYDTFIDEIEKDKLLLHKYVDFLEQYWEPRVKYMKNCQIQDTQEWRELLCVGNKVRISIEPLKIAWCFHKKRRNHYSRPKWLHQLEIWQKDDRKRNPQQQGGPSNLESQKIHSMEDSRFWEKVEKSRKLLSSGGPSDDSKRKKLRAVDRYVMRLIGKSAVSADIFLETSTFMQWWRESQAIWEKRMMGCVRHRRLVKFMVKDPHENYMNGLI